MKKILLSLLVLFASISSASADVMHFERGGASTVTGLVEKHQLNYEGGLFSYADEFNGDGWGFALGSTKIRYGLLDKLELRLTNSGVLIDDSVAGFDNLGLGFKVPLIEEEHGIIPVINLVTDFQIPIGREELRNSGFGHSYLLAISHSITDRLAALVDIGLGFTPTEGNFGDATTVDVPYVFNLSYAVNDKLGLFTDFYGQWGLSSLSSSPLSQDFGFAYAITDNFIFDLSLNWGLNEPAPDFGVDFGVAVRLN